MLSYLAFIHHGIETIGNPLSDGQTLARRCVDKLEKLGDEKQFPPRLLILLASPAYLDAQKPEQLLNGVFQGFHDREIPELIGCSVAAVFFKRRIYREGALLICLASRLLEAKVEASPDASHDPEKAVKSLLYKLDLYTAGGDENHSFANRTLFVLFPGFGGNKYLAPELHESLRSRLGGRTSIFGGVASANDPQRVRSGILFANRKVHRNAVVAASIECGTPLGISLTQGLTDTGGVLNVAELDPQDRRIIRRFREGTVVDEMAKLQKNSHMPLFTNLGLNHEPTVDTPLLEKGAVRLTREVRESEPLHIVNPEPEQMQQAFRNGIEQSSQRAWLLNPIAGLGFRCAGLLRHSDKIGLDLEYESALIEHDLSRQGNPIEKPFVGGFVDGEAGVDKNGKSMLGNWSNATLIFGDELRFRTPVYRGFEKLADFAGMKVAETYNKGIDRLTQLVYDIGFPGALLSFCLHDHEKTTIVGQSASGSRYERLLENVETYPLDGGDVLAAVARAKQPRPIIDSRKETCGSMKAASEVGIVSQYIVPLTLFGGEVNALLQIDLGDISYDTGLFETEKIVLDWLGKIVNSGLNSTFSWEESKIISNLDQAMKACLSAETIKQGLQGYLKHTLEAFGLEMGNIRIAQEDKHCLSRVAGIGIFFEGSQAKRREVDFGEKSPTAQAFRDDKIIIINDAPNSEAHQDICRRWEEEDEELGRKLREIGSCANVPFRSERGERGTINLVSRKPWFFMRFHESALEVLGERAGFLLETLRRKEAESFLTGVSPQLSQIPNLNDISSILANEISQFAQTARAEIASLYLWEEGRQLYVLRAQFGWHTKDEWVNAACYTTREFWTGTSAVAGVPRHIPDLNKYYTKNLKNGEYPAKTQLYLRCAFGRPLSSEFTVEAIGLQLRIADGDRLGVLTLYRSTNPGDESGFVTTDTELLQKGADNFAGLIGILQTRRRENWEKQERARRQRVYDATILGQETDHFEPRVCRQVLDAYCAVKTSFYKVGIADGTLMPRVSFGLDSQTGQVSQSIVAPDQLVQDTAQANRQSEREIKFERVRLEPEDEDNPRRVAVANQISRACVPLVSEKKLVGILDIHWSLYDNPADLPDYEQDQNFLRMLGEVIGSAYGRAETKKRAEIKLAEGEAKLGQGETKLLESEQINSVAFQTTNAYVMQTEHELRSMLTDMVVMLYSVKSAISEGAEEKGRQLIEELLEHVRESNRGLSKLIQIGARMFAPDKEIVSVKKLISRALAKERERCERLEIKVTVLDIPADTSIDVDPVLLVSAIDNIVDNAIKYMQNCEHRQLTIGATTSFDAGTVIIAIKDTGAGMTWNKRKKVLKGFVPHKGRVSAGVPITKLILWIFGGSLDYVDRGEAAGTEALITLPLHYPEKTL